MNTFKSFRYLSVAVLLGAWGCSQKQVATKGDYDDLYGSSKDAPEVAYKTSTRPSIYQNPDFEDNLRYQREESPVQAEGTDEYYDENYVNSRKVKRSYSAEPGYSSGFSDGYQSGWNDYAWSQPMGWASPFSRFGYYSPFGYNSFGYNSINIGFGLGLGMGYGGFGGRYYDPFWGSRFYDPFWGGGFYSPYYSSIYSPWGYSPWGGGFYSPYDYYGYGGYYGGYPGYYYNATAGVVGAARNRTYGPRDGGRGSAYYNDRFNNTAIRTNESGRRADGSNARTTSVGSGGRTYTGNDGYYAAPRRNGGYNSSFDNTPSASRSNSSSNDTYYARPRRNGGYETPGSSSSSYSRPSSSNTRSSNSWSSGSGSSSRGSDSWRSSGSSSNSSWSSGSSSRGSSSGSSSSSGASRGGGGGGGGSRGPR
ncbi:hypothetical protein [Emticicia sp. 21SJ11W-3]|uniref:hypothetical protein n=1 Tax=Emticicia sp. 21SJ11W-3 TaxID=2916755 RepID=UPI00209F10D5|nr:hypothetical protein [Emticicia sp. 21SJ11W-3]UTA69902.1 hypothetical protein MB380_08815 [Emticicia sp. 21SJ11W-3]